MKTSCGFLIEYRGLFLLCHATRQDGLIAPNDNKWGIPKGEIEENGTPYSTAIRETLEETGINLNNYSKSTIPIYNYKTKNKNYIVYYCLINSSTFNHKNLHCSSLIEGTNLPENDFFIWVKWETAKEMVKNNNQKLLFTEEVRKKIKLC
jgi:8-oxo-dGTP pyrophosphatase MutT (NUDIX family)